MANNQRDTASNEARAVQSSQDGPVSYSGAAGFRHNFVDDQGCPSAHCADGSQRDTKGSRDCHVLLVAQSESGAKTSSAQTGQKPSNAGGGCTRAYAACTRGFLLVLGWGNGLGDLRGAGCGGAKDCICNFACKVFVAASLAARSSLYQHKTELCPDEMGSGTVSNHTTTLSPGVARGHIRTDSCN